MKKLLFITVLLMSAMGLRAQESHFGAKLGLNHNAFNTTTDGYKGKLGYEISLVSEFKLNDQFAVAPELLFEFIGEHYEYSSELYGTMLKLSGDYSFNYIQIPVMGRYYINDAFSLEFGPQIGFLLSAEGKIETSTLRRPATTNSENNTNLKKDFESTEFGLNLGTGYKLENGLFFNLRYTIGLLNISKKDDVIKNNTFRLGVGYFFN